MTAQVRKVSAPGARRRPKSRGQAIVEMALVSLVLGMMLAAAIDFGRAFYTATVVTNMAGEGAAYAAIYPDRDAEPGQQYCSIFTVDQWVSIQERARRVGAPAAPAVSAGAPPSRA